MRDLSPRAHDIAIANSASDSALAFAIFIDLLDDPLASIPVSALCAKLVRAPPPAPLPPGGRGPPGRRAGRMGWAGCGGGGMGRGGSR